MICLVMAFRWWDLTFFLEAINKLFGGGDFFFVKSVHKSLIYIRLKG